MPIAQAMMVLAGVAVLVLYNISKNTREQTKLTAKMVEKVSFFAQERAETAEEQTTGLNKRIKKLEEERESDREERESDRARIVKLEEQLRLTTEDRDRLLTQLEEQTKLASEALKTLGKLRDALSRGEKTQDELRKQIINKDGLIREKDAEIKQLTEERDDLLSQIQALTQQMTVLRKRIQELEKKPESKPEPVKTEEKKEEDKKIA